MEGLTLVTLVGEVLFLLLVGNNKGTCAMQNGEGEVEVAF